ncbi:hypothetical protein HY480_01605 [Candidatus Uhrbacteria bacterium]|nr:hypothetical protein [Candidatus Uhrbacteria bacterium]
MSGTPEDLISGHGAFGDAGRIGGWRDGIVLLRPGDVLRITESRSEGVRYVLWVEEDGTPKTATWQDWENLQVVAKAEAIVAEATEKPEAMSIAFGRMPCFTYSGSSTIESGIEVGKGATGSVVALGESGRGRKLAEVPIVGFAPGERLDAVAVAVLSEKEIAPRPYSGDQPVISRIYGLVEAPRAEVGAALVRTRLPHACRTFGEVKALRGAPTLLAKGLRAGGIAGRADCAEDALWVLRHGESVAVDESGRYGFSSVISNNSGKVSVTSWTEWEIADGLANPSAYVAKGKAPWGHAPAEWVGRVVQVFSWVQEYESRERKSYPELQERHEGELVSVSATGIVLNLGWDGLRDRQLVTINSGVWVRLDAEKKVTRADASAEQEREAAKADVARLQSVAKLVREAGHFACFEDGLRARIIRVAEGRESSGCNDDLIDFSLFSTANVRGWAKEAEAVMAKVSAAEAGAQALASRQEAGEVLANFQVWKRRGGATNCGEGWVVRPDGSAREPDRMDCPRPRHRDEGTQRWDFVAPEELAITWGKGYTAAPHDFVVAKLPVGGLTDAQRETVQSIEQEIADQWRGATGMSGKSSPDIGKGWGLRKEELKPAPVAATPPSATEKEKSVDEHKLTTDEVADFRAALAKKFGGR